MGASYPDNPINNDHDSPLEVDVNMDVDVDLSPSNHFLCSSKDPLEALVSSFTYPPAPPRGGGGVG